MQQVDWGRLFIFSKTADAGSLSKAAGVLHLSHSALSRQISILEKEVGSLLFRREPRGLVLTTEGKLLYKAAQNIATRVGAIEMRLLENKDVPQGLIRIEVTDILGTFWLPQRLLEFSSRYPNIYFKVTFTEAPPDFSSNKTDISISLFSTSDPNFICSGPIKSPTGVYASESYLKNYGLPEKISDLDNHHLLILRDLKTVSPFLSHWHWILEVGRPPSASPRPFSFSCNSLQGLYYATKNHVGIAQLPKFCIRPEDHLVELFLDVDKPLVSRYVTCPKEALFLKRVTLFRSFILEQLIFYFSKII